MNCKFCGKKSESEYCFIHKPKKALSKTKKILKGYKKETKTIECKECLGTGKIEKLICTKPVSECCGGCYTYKECSNCGGSGEVEIEIEVEVDKN